MILQWHRQRGSSYTARWNGINFILDLDDETARWVCRANGRKLTVHKRVQTWSSPIAAMEHMDRVQTAELLRKSNAVAAVMRLKRLPTSTTDPRHPLFHRPIFQEARHVSTA